MRKDQEGLNNGKVSIDINNTTITVGRRYSLRITYTAGSECISAGGCLRFKLPGVKVNEVAAYCSNPDVELECSTAVPIINGKKGFEFFTQDYLFITIRGGTLKTDDTITIDYGCNAVSKYVSAPQFVQEYKIEAATDRTGDRSAPGSGFFLVKDTPVLHFASDSAVKLEITIPSNTKAGVPYEMVVRARDKYNNIAEGYNGRITLFTSAADQTAPFGDYVFTKQDRGIHIFKDFVFDKCGINRITASDEGLCICGRSNPSRTCDGYTDYNTYWGDTHTHSILSADEAAGNCLYKRPGGVYEYARNVSDLDFCMVTDHSQDLTEDDWKETQDAAKVYNEPGKFVTFSAFEATHDPLRQDGDKNIYFLTDDISFTNQGSTSGLYSHLKKYKGRAMSIPHQHARTNWKQHDPELERVAEIYSHWGCGLSPDSEPPMIPGPRNRMKPENYVNYALEQGFRIGFIASADHSYGHPGDDFWWQLSSYNGGLAAVFSKELTRDGIWEGIWNRRCYATTRARILLQFEIDGHVMGEEFNEISETAAGRKIFAAVNGTASLMQIDVIKNGLVLYSEMGNEDLDMELTYFDTKVERDTDYYYLHIVQVDGEQAWSSPIWVNKFKLQSGVLK